VRASKPEDTRSDSPLIKRNKTPRNPHQTQTRNND